MSAPPVETRAAYSERDVILYHLGLGAGDPPCAQGELRYTYERTLEVLPSFASVARVGPTDALMNMPGIALDQTRVLQVEQEVELQQRSLPCSASVTAARRVVGVLDKGNAALLQYETRVHIEGGSPLFISRVALFARGEGGFGGPRGAKPVRETPMRSPDGNMRINTLPQQALIFRLSGDTNPLHADPQVARAFGLDRPILHGLCVYGMVCRAVQDCVLRPDASVLRRYKARFAGIFYPGETLEVQWWRDTGAVRAIAFAVERKQPVLSDVVFDIA